MSAAPRRSGRAPLLPWRGRGPLGGVPPVVVAAALSLSACNRPSRAPEPARPVVQIEVSADTRDLQCRVGAAAAGSGWEVAWTVDGVPFEAARTGQLPRDTVVAGDTRPGQTWTCRVHAAGASGTAGDGLATVVLLAAPMKLTLAPAGSFDMGSPPDEPCRSQDETLHRVTLTRDFLIGVHEVTVAQFQEVMGYAPSSDPTCRDCPVDMTAWSDAAAFTNALSVREGLEPCYRCRPDRPPTPRDPNLTTEGCRFTCSSPVDPYACEGYRLPTEAEWEYAARAGSTGSFITGGRFPPDHDCADMCKDLELDDGHDLGELGWFCGNSREGGTFRVRPVGLRLANAWGLYDVHGNVDEWCNEATDRSDYRGDEVDPVGMRSGGLRVLRGGTHDWGSYLLRLGARWWDPPASCFAPHIGFRVARTRPR